MRKYIILSILIAIPLLIIISLLYFYYFTHHLLITKITPSNSNVPSGQIITATTYIDFYFNKPLNKESIKQNSIFSDQNIIQKIDINEKSIRIHIINLTKDQKYSIYFKDITSSDGYTLQDYQYTVTAVYMSNYQPTKEELAEQHRQTDATNSTNPIYKVVPYQTLDYSISAGGSITESSTPPTINIYVNLSSADYNSPNPQAIIEAKRLLARNYLIAKGIDLSKYNIVYTQTPNNYAN